MGVGEVREELRNETKNGKQVNYREERCEGKDPGKDICDKS